MVEIVPVEMEAACEVVGGLGEGTLCQEVREELGDPASYCRWFFYLQMGDLLLVCTGERRGEAMRGDLRKKEVSDPLSQSLWTLEGKQLRSTCLRHSQLAAHLSPTEKPKHLPRLAWSWAQRSQNWLGSEDQYKLS